MTKQIIVALKDWKRKGAEYCRELEKGNILFLPKMPFSFSKKSPEIFARKAREFLEQLLPLYAKEWKVGEISGNEEREGKWQIDAARHVPTHGARILRVFINIHPTQAKRWITSAPFVELVKQFGGKEVPFPSSMRYSLQKRWGRKLKELLNVTGLKKALRSPYDRFMWRMRNFLRKNREFQETCMKEVWEFPPSSCWLAFTDQIPHASIEGGSVMQQSFFVPTSALLYPEQSPIGILERLSGRNLVNMEYFQKLFSEACDEPLTRS